VIEIGKTMLCLTLAAGECPFLDSTVRKRAVLAGWVFQCSTLRQWFLTDKGLINLRRGEHLNKNCNKSLPPAVICCIGGFCAACDMLRGQFSQGIFAVANFSTEL
jgi:hypothetical protein